MLISKQIKISNMYNLINFKKMTTVNFKNSVIVLAIGLVVASCGGRGGNQQSGTATSEQAKVETKSADYANQETGTQLSASDWQAVVKANYDFDLTVPSGFTFKEGRKENINPAYRVDFNVTAADFKAALKEIHQYLFDLTAKITPADGNFAMKSYRTPDNPAVKGDKIPELKLNAFIGELQPDMWHFNTPKGAVQIAIANSEPNKFVRVSLVFLGKVE
jgi:hypothetical protein